MRRRDLMRARIRVNPSDDEENGEGRNEFIRVASEERRRRTATHWRAPPSQEKPDEDRVFGIRVCRL